MNNLFDVMEFNNCFCNYIKIRKISMKLITISGMLVLITITGFTQVQVPAEEINPDIVSKTWNALWITHPTASLNGYGVFHFRKTFDLEEKPDKFIVHVTADNRYRLYVNGTPVVLGPAWGDLHHWRFESTDIAPLLKKGNNIIAAQVVNFGYLRPVSQMTYKTGFLLQGDSEKEAVLNTHPDTWEVLQNNAYSPIIINRQIVPHHYVASPCDTFRTAQHPWGWQIDLTGKHNWLKPACVNISLIDYCKRGTPRPGGHYFNDQSPWFLVPRNIPFLEETKQYFAEIERQENIAVPERFIEGEQELVIPANTKISVLLDQKSHTRAYPELYFSGGDNSIIEISYAEALVDSLGIKGNRDVTDGKHMVGYFDVVIADGKPDRSFRPLWHRVFRYVELKIETFDQPLVIDSFYTIFTGYPYELKADFETTNPVHRELFEMGWRTLRSCTGEVFEDGPYYEQAMYGGDARVESIVSLYMSGDEQITKNAIDLFDNSRIPEGLTNARYPSNMIQINPQYSLCWVQMIYDYFMYGEDTRFVKDYLEGIRGVLAWHERLIDETGMLGVIPWLRHIEALSGSPVHPERGHSAQQTLFYALTLDYAAEMFNYFGFEEQSHKYLKLSEDLKIITYSLCWDNDKNLLGDTPEKDVFTHHANVLGILTDAIPEKEQQEVMRLVLTDTSLIQSYFFFRFWVFQALEKTGLGNEFLENIYLWERLTDYGLTTFPEFRIESRSDCHAWSSHINCFFLTTVAGIKPAKPGFKEVIIEPHPGNEKFIRATMPHYKGKIEVNLNLEKKNNQQAKIYLPEGLSGSFIWKGEKKVLHPGKQTINL